MTNGEAIIEVLRDHGPLSRDLLCGAVQAGYRIPPVITATVLKGMEIEGKVVVRDGLYSLPTEGHP